MADTSCGLCHLPGATRDAGGDLGLVHQRCFDPWDRASEAQEHLAVTLFADLPLHVEPAPVVPLRPVRMRPGWAPARRRPAAAEARHG